LAVSFIFAILLFMDTEKKRRWNLSVTDLILGSTSRDVKALG